MTSPQRKDRFGDNPWLKDWLINPKIMSSYTQLPELWKQTVIYFICDRPKAMQPGLWMARSARGAMGRVLKGWHDQGRPHCWPGSAFEGLYQSHAMLNGEHVPKPLGIRVTDCGETIEVELRLFAEAGMWRDDVIEAMTTAFASGIGLWENGKILRPWPLRDWWWEQQSVRTIEPFTSRAVLSFETPFKPGATDLFAGDLENSLKGLLKRVAGMARWSGIDISSNSKPTPTALAALKLIEIPPDHCLDGFVKQNGQGGIAVVGARGKTHISGISEELWSCLSLGQDIGIGGHRAYGFGRYRCEIAGRL